LQEIFNAGYDPDDALALAEKRGWQSVKPSWYFKEKEPQNERNGSNGYIRTTFAPDDERCVCLFLMETRFLM
jgi:hypothetical protein